MKEESKWAFRFAAMFCLIAVLALLSATTEPEDKPAEVTVPLSMAPGDEEPVARFAAGGERILHNRGGW